MILNHWLEGITQAKMEKNAILWEFKDNDGTIYPVKSGDELEVYDSMGETLLWKGKVILGALESNPLQNCQMGMEFKVWCKLFVNGLNHPYKARFKKLKA